MAITWITPPNTFIASDTPLVFQTSAGASIVAISVSFGNTQAEERAYRGGAFLYPYLGSSQTGSEYTLQRSGGWPAGATVHVDEFGGGADDMTVVIDDAERVVIV